MDPYCVLADGRIFKPMSYQPFAGNLLMEEIKIPKKDRLPASAFVEPKPVREENLLGQTLTKELRKLKSFIVASLKKEGKQIIYTAWVKTYKPRHKELQTIGLAVGRTEEEARRRGSRLMKKLIDDMKLEVGHPHTIPFG